MLVVAVALMALQTIAHYREEAFCQAVLPRFRDVRELFLNRKLRSNCIVLIVCFVLFVYTLLK